MSSWIAAVFAAVVGGASTVIAQPIEWSLEIGGNGHYYQFIPTAPETSWLDARDDASRRVFPRTDAQLLHGYLATITSRQEEAFLQSRYPNLSEVWIGGSDAAVEGEWRWVTGPESTLDGGQGQLFWIGRGDGGAHGFTNWIRGEPNQVGDEDYLVWNHDGIGWNDALLQPFPARSNDRISGYLVEFGDSIVVPPPPPVVPLHQGLLGYWSFDGNAADSSGAGRDLVLKGDPDFNRGLFGQAISLYGYPDQFAERPVDDSVFAFGSGDFTIQVWALFNHSESEQTLIEQFDGCCGPGWTLTAILQRDVIQFYAAGDSVTEFAVPNLSLDDWHHIVVRRVAGALVDLFVDGVGATGASGGFISEASFPLLIGKRNELDGRDFPLDGLLDEIAVWERALSDEEILSLYNGGAGRLIPLPTAGDFNGNGSLDVGDIDLLIREVQIGGTDARFDLNSDGRISIEDRVVWVEQFANTYFGDSNLDKEFNSRDLVLVFQAGEYEDGNPGNSTWATGDWDGDGDFTSGDFVLAFRRGGYEQGPRANVAAVPEPAGMALAIAALPFLAGRGPVKQSRGRAVRGPIAR